MSLKILFLAHENANNESLRNTFNKCRNLLPKLKKEEASNKIINIFIANKAKNVKNNPKKRIVKLITIYLNNEDKNKKYYIPISMIGSIDPYSLKTMELPELFRDSAP